MVKKWNCGFLVLLLALLLGIKNGQCQRSIGVDWEYAVECAGTAKDGSYIVSVVCEGKNLKKTIEMAMKSAIHAVLFKGVDGTVAGCVKHGALVTNPNAIDEHTVFFKALFKDDIYKRFVIETPGTVYTTIKTSRGIRVVITLTVIKDELRKYLEKNGVIRGLSTGF